MASCRRIHCNSFATKSRLNQAGTGVQAVYEKAGGRQNIIKSMAYNVKSLDEKTGLDTSRADDSPTRVAPALRATKPLRFGCRDRQP